MSGRERRAGCGPAAAGLAGFVLGAATVLLIVWATLRPATWQAAPAPVVTPGPAAGAGVAGGAPPVRGGPGTGRGRPAAPIPTAELPQPPPPVPPPPDLRHRSLLLPVQGVERRTLLDTYHDPRGGGRLHEALDIMAPRGTPVLAADDGRVAKLFTSARGGLTLYQFDPRERYTYYYAHLDRYAPGLTEQSPVRRGQLLAYVGASGNAGQPHLHFAIFRLGPEKRWWQGTPINPYPLFRDELAATAPPG
jgi:murein DD-endopeptidase MepM/ murein hydrolase activator NlpD